MNLYKVAAQGRFMWREGRSTFPRAEAIAMAADLRSRGYADAHAQRYVPGLGPLALTLVVAAIGCGGVPFETTPFVGTGGDAGADVRAAVPFDAGGDVAVGDPPPAEASAQDGGSNDAAACTPVPEAIGYRAYGCSAMFDVDPDAGTTIPTYFAWETQGLPIACGVAKTPPECTCADTFTCVCLRKANVCDRIAAELDAGVTWFACNDVDTNMPTVTCVGR